MAVAIAGFDWDHGNIAKCQAHRVSIAEIEGVFRGTLSVYPNPAHSAKEQRFQAIGTTGYGRYVFVAFTLRERNGRVLIRPISARYMHRKEVRHYEATASRASQR